MSSWPPTQVDWRTLTPRLRHGATVCVVHGLVDAIPAANGIPVCPHCEQLVSFLRRGPGGALREFTEPAPAHCPAGHPLTLGAVLRSWTACTCPAVLLGPGGHRIWRCIRCPDTAEALTWPPHTAESHAGRGGS